ncbi:hypothetical protein KIL84_012403 [Mauremys mutica]|uniref:Uncharacterized protein n=1 Tax=Mauremys mutica TaxID=74926 RepID=A0A9D3XZA2_9SAUR|nr:hypothetical protein KIL84_012403 [Mauremys mutica]
MEDYDSHEALRSDEFDTAEVSQPNSPRGRRHPVVRSGLHRCRYLGHVGEDEISHGLEFQLLGSRWPWKDAAGSQEVKGNGLVCKNLLTLPEMTAPSQNPVVLMHSVAFDCTTVERIQGSGASSLNTKSDQSALSFAM